jgi:hypothetical protein
MTLNGKILPNESKKIMLLRNQLDASSYGMINFYP